jgi:2'-5' RNA ligase
LVLGERNAEDSNFIIVMQAGNSKNIHRQDHKMYFIAVVCPQQIDEKILEYKHWMRDRFGCKAALKSPAHLTLIAPFWLEETKEPELLNVFDAFSTNIPAFVVKLNNFSHFSNRVLFVHVDTNEPLAMLQSEVETWFHQHFSNEIKLDQRPFHPHATIANRDMSPPTFLKAWQHFSKEDFNALFTVSSISLLKLSPGKWNVIREKIFTPA